MNKQEHAFSRGLFYILACLLLAACGSGGNDTVPLQGVSSYQLTATAPTGAISPTGSTAITLSLKDSSGTPAANQTIQLSKTGPATITAGSVTTGAGNSSISVVTDAAGTASVVLSGASAAVGSSGSVEAKYTDSKGSIAKSSASYSIQESETVILTLSKPTVNSGSGDGVALSALVIDSNGLVVTSKPVTFAVSGGLINGTITNATASSASYVPSTTDRSNKQVTVIASLAGGGSSASAVINVVGTTVQISSPSTSATVGDVITLQGSLKDGNGAAIAGANVTLTSANLTGGTKTITTLADGSFPAVSTTITSSPTATFTASSNGASSSFSLTVSGVSFKFTTPAANAEATVSAPSVPPLTPTPITVTHLNNGAPVAGTTVNFSTSLGSLSSSTAITDAAGKATVNIGSTAAGQAVISANATTTTGVALQTSQSLLFVGGTPDKIAVQAGQTNLVPNTQTPITATLLDAGSNPVKGKIVEFNLVQNDSHGSLSAATAITDASGKATVSYTAGPDSTATDGVKIRASLQGSSTIKTKPFPDSPSDVRITVGGQAQFISITGGNTLESNTATVYNEPRGVIVTDASGNPVANKIVTLSIIPVQYYKGRYVPGQQYWTAVPSVTCDNEDTNLDGNVTPAEDINGNGILTPGNAVTLSTPNVTTNAQGIASFNVVYGKNYGNWLRVKLKASSGVTGTESVTEMVYDLSVLSTDVVVTGSPPGGVVSVFGQAAVCTDPN